MEEMEEERGGAGWNCIGGTAQVVNETARVGCNLLRPPDNATMLYMCPATGVNTEQPIVKIRQIFAT